MKVFAFLKIWETAGNAEGDIISFHRITDKPEEVGLDALNYFYPVMVDINVPCGADYEVKARCSRCEHNDPESCDVIKYTRGIWKAGDLFTVPKLETKRQYKIDWKPMVDEAKIDAASKKGKTYDEMVGILKAAMQTTVKITDIVVDKIGIRI